MFPPLPCVASDSFDRAGNESPVSLYGNWTAITGLGNMKFTSASSEAGVSTAATACGMAYTGGFNASKASNSWPVWGNDQWAGGVIGTLTNTGSAAYLFVRIAGNTYYQLSLTSPAGSSETHTLYSVVNGVPTSIGTFTATIAAATDFWMLSVQGTTINVYQNTTSVLTVTDNTISSGVPGFGGYSASGTTRIHWYGFAAGTTVSATIPTFTQAFEDTFNRANESPLNPTNWYSVGVQGPGQLPTYDNLEVLSDACTTTTSVQDDGQATLLALAASQDQFLQVTTQNWPQYVAFAMYARCGQPYIDPAYTCYVSSVFDVTIGYAFSSLSIYNLDSSGSGFNYDFLGILPIISNSGDVFAWAAVGQTNGFLYCLQNGNLLFMQPTNLNPQDGIDQPYSGVVGLQLSTENSPPNPGDISIINFITGPAGLGGGGGTNGFGLLRLLGVN